jgi:exopolysaccharide production protein ExoQ
MTSRATAHFVPDAVIRVFASSRFAASLTLIALGLAFSTHLLRSVMGWPGLLGALAALTVLAILSMIARRQSIEWHGLLPLSILAFIGWSALSVLWSTSATQTLLGVGYQITFAFLAIYIALVRDTIQIVRATGDVLRVLLALSLALEVVSGLLLDLPIVFLGIHGNIAQIGPLQGVFGSRNVLGLVSLIAVVTFAIELRSRSVSRQTGIASLVLATLTLVFTHSPVMLVVTLATALAALALYGLRRSPAAGRWSLQAGLLGTALLIGVLAWTARDRILELLNAGSQFDARLTLWQEMRRLVALHPLEGWGWVGRWPITPITPYGWLDFSTQTLHTSGLNAFLDVYFQLGLVGLALFGVLVALAFGRSWLLASSKHTLVYTWAPLILVVLLVTSAAESTILVEFGWLLLLICSVKAARDKSWRSALARKPWVDPDLDR